ncbi:transmembrane protein 229A-like [Canis lupus baileyi]|uniref:transmembrane protein 229A-like n=1 Tax=Canis lupus baileyi TaxID=143281 RepID=UPI003B96F5AE
MKAFPKKSVEDLADRLPHKAIANIKYTAPQPGPGPASGVWREALRLASGPGPGSALPGVPGPRAAGAARVTPGGGFSAPASPADAVPGGGRRGAAGLPRRDPAGLCAEGGAGGGPGEGGRGRAGGEHGEAGKGVTARFPLQERAAEAAGRSGGGDGVRSGPRLHSSVGRAEGARALPAAPTRGSGCHRAAAGTELPALPRGPRRRGPAAPRTRRCGRGGAGGRGREAAASRPEPLSTAEAPAAGAALPAWSDSASTGRTGCPGRLARSPDLRRLGFSSPAAACCTRSPASPRRRSACRPRCPSASVFSSPASPSARVALQTPAARRCGSACAADRARRCGAAALGLRDCRTCWRSPAAQCSRSASCACGTGAARAAAPALAARAPAAPGAGGRRRPPRHRGRRGAPLGGCRTRSAFSSSERTAFGMRSSSLSWAGRRADQRPHVALVLLSVGQLQLRGGETLLPPALEPRLEHLEAVPVYVTFLYAWELCRGLGLRSCGACSGDYSHYPLNFMGLITLMYLPGWIFLSVYQDLLGVVPGSVHTNYLKEKKKVIRVPRTNSIYFYTFKTEWFF